MQRKNNILNSRYPQHSGFAMIMAITVIVIVATIMALALALTTQTVKKTTDLYLYEQAILLSKSATEYALLQVATNPPCSDIDANFIQDTIYTIDFTVEYIYYDDPATALDEALIPCTANGGTLYTRVATPEQNGSIIMDVTVSTNVGTEPITYFRRTIQKL